MINDSNLANQYTLEKINQLDHPFEEFEKESLENTIPIITREIQHMLLFYIRNLKPKNILEIGTAVGFSATLMAKECKSWGGKLTTIEINEERYAQAKANFLKFGVSERVKVIFGDARDIIPTLDEAYDFIFIDAAKSKYEFFFEEGLKKLKHGGVIFIDNLMFKGSVYEDIKKYRTIGNNLNKFIENLMKKNFLLLPIGDGIGIYIKDEEN